MTNEVDISPIQQETLSQPSEPPEEDEASPLQMEALSQASEHSEKDETSPLQMEVLSRPSERFEKNEASPLQMEALSRPSEPPEKNEAFPLQMEALSGPSEPPEKNEASPLQMEALSWPSEPPEEDEASPLQMEAMSRPSECSEKNEASTLQMEALSWPSERSEKNEASPLQMHALSRPSERSEKNEASPLQMEALSQASERFEKNEASTLQMEALSRPSERSEKNEASTLQMEALSWPSERSEKNEASPLQMHALSRPSERSEKNEASPLQMDTLSRPSEPSEKNEASPLQMEALSGPSESPEKNEASPLQMEALAQPLEPPEEVQHSSIQQEAPTQAPEFPTIPVSNNIARGLTGLFEAYKSNLPSVTLKSLDEELTVTPEPSEDVESSTVQQEFPPQPPEPFGGGPSPTQEEASAPPPEPPNEAEYSPIQQKTPAQFPKEVEPLETLQEPPAQPPDHDELRISTQAQLPESSPGVLDQPSVRPEVTLSPLGLGEAYHSTSPPVTISMDLGLSITAKPTEEIKTPSHQEAPSEAPEKTKSSPGQQGSPALPPKPFKEAEPSLTQQGVHTQPSEAPEKVEPSPVQQEAAQQSPETPKKVIVQPPLHQEVTVPASGQDQAPHPLSPSITIPPSDLGLIVTAEPTTEAKSSEALTKITAPSPRHLDVTLPHPEHVQSQHPNPTEVTLQPVDLDVTVTQQPESSETLPATTEQSASRHMDICKLCTCHDGMLLCTGLRPEQQLHRVPELESHSYNGTFTVVNLRGNSISYIDESVWKSYRWVEKLILSENNLTELHKDSFEGLLSLQYLDLSYNRIESVERHTFEPLPFLRYINLGGNSITELSFGTFQAWHGMQFLHKIILDRNPMTTVEDSYLLKLPALRYLDMGRTQVSLTTVERVLMMSLKLENLILPIRKTCCICQFKSDIEVVCETVKLHCDTECLTDIAHCDEEVSVGNEEGSFMKVLQARKKKTSTVLTIEPEKPSSHKYGINLAAFMNDQLDFSEENEAIRALKYILPYFSKGNVTDVESKLLPLIKLLFLNTEDGDMPLSHLTNNARNPSLKPEYTGATYKNKLRKLNSLKNFLDAEIQEKKDEFKKKEKTAMLIHSNLLSSKLKRQIFQKELQTDQTQGYSLAKSQPVQKRLLRGNRVLKGPKGIRKRHFKEVAHQSIQKKQNAPPIVENTVKVRRLEGPPPRELGQLPMVHRPRKLVGNSFNTESSFVKEREAAVSSFLKQYLLGWFSASIAPKSLSKAKKPIDLSDTTFILDEANARIRNMKASKPISHSRKKHLFYKSSRVMHKATKSKKTQEFGKEDSLKRLMLAKRPPISALRSLINSPAREAFSSSGELISQENHLPESVSLLETSKEKSTAQIPFQEKISTQKATVPEKTTPEIPARENVFTTDLAVTADNFLPTVNQTHETQGEYPSVATDLLSNSTGFTSPLLSSPGEQFENQLNQQLQFVIPNNEERKLIAHVIRTFKMDCSEVSVQLPCARLISRTGLLMKRLSEQQEVKMYKAEWGIDLRKNENYISESTEARTEQKGQEPREWTKVPTHRKQKKLILVICVLAVVMILIIIFCLIKIYSHKRKSEEGKEGRSRGCFGFRRCKKNPSKRERQNSFWRQQPLWLQSTGIPLNDSRVKMMAETLEDPDTSDEDETTDKIKGELHEVIVH